GGRTSIPNVALPVAFSAVSSRFNERPIKRKALLSLSGGALGGSIAAARPPQTPGGLFRAGRSRMTGRFFLPHPPAPPLPLRPPPARRLRLRGGPSTKKAGAQAPAWRKGFQKARTEFEPPVT